MSALTANAHSVMHGEELPLNPCLQPTVQWHLWLAGRLGLVASSLLILLTSRNRSVFSNFFRRLLIIVALNDMISSLFICLVPLVSMTFIAVCNNNLQMSFRYDTYLGLMVCSRRLDHLLKTEMPMLMLYNLAAISMAFTHTSMFLSCIPFYFRYRILVQ